MDSFAYPPAANWNSPHILDVSDDGKYFSYGSRSDVVIVSDADKGTVREFKVEIIPKPEKGRITAVKFISLTVNSDDKELYLASCSEMGQMKVWNLENCDLLYQCSSPFVSNEKNKWIDLGCFDNSSNLLAASEGGNILSWDVSTNKATMYTINLKTSVKIIAPCPHQRDLVAVGGYNGLVIIYSLKDKGHVVHKIRCHESTISFLSWCPVPYNVVELKKLEKQGVVDTSSFKEHDRSLLLASSSKERYIYISKAGTNGFCETVASLPSRPLEYRSMNRNNADGFHLMKWITENIIISSTGFNELISIDLFEAQPVQKNSQGNNIFVNIEYRIKLIHKAHRMNIVAFATTPFNRESGELNIWSAGTDRLLVRCTYSPLVDSPLFLTLPTLAGMIYSLAVSSVNPDLLAIGTGDSRICVWNMSSMKSMDVTTLYKKIDSRVMSIAWHPSYEGVLAFGTMEGRVGLFDMNQGIGSPPTLLKLLHNKPIYRLCWAFNDAMITNKKGMNSDDRSLCLYAVGNGNIVQYNPNNPAEMPEIVKSPFNATEEKYAFYHKSDICIEPGRKFAAVGYSNGNLFICPSDLSSVYEVLREHTSSILSMAWHPLLVSANRNQYSPCSDWLATASNSVIVYKITGELSAIVSKIAHFNTVHDRVLSVAWNPHENGQLLTTSAENTATVWDVLTQTTIAVYSGHEGKVMCGVWSLLSPDIAITGGTDITVRVWNVKKTSNCVKNVSKNEISQKKLAVRKTSVAFADTGAPIPSSPYTSLAERKNATKMQEMMPTIRQGMSAEDCPLLEAHIEKVIAKSNAVEPKADSSDASESSGVCNGIDFVLKVAQSKRSSLTNGSTESNITYLNLFGTDEELNAFIEHEEQVLLKANNTVSHSCLTLTRCSLEEKIRNAMREKTMNDALLAKAPAVSFQLWEEACQAYVEQLTELTDAEATPRVVSFMLVTKKFEDAIRLLCDRKCFKEAYLIARKFCADNANLLKDVLEKWAFFCASNGQFRQAAHCYLAAGNMHSASLTLCRSRQIKTIVTGAKLLMRFDEQKATEHAMGCFIRLMGYNKWTDVENLLQDFPTLMYLKPWLVTSKYLATNTIDYNWMREYWSGGCKDFRLLTDLLNTICSTCSVLHYRKLVETVTMTTFESEKNELLFFTSGQLATFLVGWANDEPKPNICTHLVAALNRCYNYRVANISGRSSAKLFITVLRMIYPGGPRPFIDLLSEEDESIKTILKSIKAFLAYAFIDWLIYHDYADDDFDTDEENQSENSPSANDKSSGSKTEAKRMRVDIDTSDHKFGDVTVSSMETLFKKYLTIIMDADTVAYYKNLSELKKLERCGGGGNSPQCGNSPQSKHTTCAVGSATKKSDEGTDLKASIPKLLKKRVSFSDEAIVINEECASAEKQAELLKEINVYESTRVSSPNPVYFYYVARNLLSQLKWMEDLEGLEVTKLERELQNVASGLGITAMKSE